MLADGPGMGIVQSIALEQPGKKAHLHPMTNPIRPTDNEARTLGRRLIDEARYGSLAVLDNGAPMASRIAVGTAPDGAPITLVSELSHHTKALRAHPLCSLLVGEPGTKGDPLTHPRITLQAQATITEHADPVYQLLREHYLKTHPKSQLYIDFTDFVFVRFDVSEAHLNGGFGKAFHLTPADLGLAGIKASDNRTA